MNQVRLLFQVGLLLVVWLGGRNTGLAEYIGSFSIPISNPGFEQVRDCVAKDWQILNATLTTKPMTTAAGKVAVQFQSPQEARGYAGDLRQVIAPWDLHWNAPIDGPQNPRPGSAWRMSVKSRWDDTKPAGLLVFVTTKGTQGYRLVEYPGDRKISGSQYAEYTAMGIRNTSMETAWDKTMSVRIASFDNVAVDECKGVDWIRPEFAITDTKPLNLGVLARNAKPGPSPARRITNSQKAVFTADKQTVAAVLYGAVNITTPETGKPWLQTNDFVGAKIIGPQASQFEFVSANCGATRQELLLVGQDKQPGLKGGPQPEYEEVRVKFLGSPTAGMFKATLRIVTAAGNTGTLSAGREGEPLKGLYYIDIPMQVIVQ